MNKICLIAVIAALTAGGASAQTVINNPANTGYFGIRASGEITCPGEVKVGDNGAKTFKNGGGFDIGVIYNVPVVANFTIEPGISFYYNATGIKGAKDLNLPGNIGSDLDMMEHASMRKTGFRVPLMLGYHFDFAPDVSLNVFTGPELDVGLSNDMYLTTKEIAGRKFHTAPSNYGDNAILKMNRVDCNWKFGVGFNFLTNYYVGVSGAVGLCDMAKGDILSFHENRVSFTLGYNFR